MSLPLRTSKVINAIKIFIVSSDLIKDTRSAFVSSLSCCWGVENISLLCTNTLHFNLRPCAYITTASALVMTCRESAECVVVFRFQGENIGRLVATICQEARQRIINTERIPWGSSRHWLFFIKSCFDSSHFSFTYIFVSLKSVHFIFQTHGDTENHLSDYAIFMTPEWSK